MWIIVTKALSFFIYPLGLSVTLLLLSVLLRLFQCIKTATGLFALGLVVLLLGSNPTVATKLVASLEQQYPVREMKDIPTADAIIVLGGTLGLPLPPRIDIDLVGPSDRVRHAAKLYLAGKAKTVVVTGGNVFEQKEKSEAFHIANLLVEWGVDKNAIAMEGESRNTRQNALQTKTIMQRLRLNNALLVTTSTHMPRSMAVFRKLDLKVIAAPTDIHVVSAEMPAGFNWLPSVSALNGTTEALHEYWGMLVYKLRDWI